MYIDLPLQDSGACSGWNSQNKFLTESIIPSLACTVHVPLVNVVHLCLDSYVSPEYCLEINFVYIDLDHCLFSGLLPW